LAAAPPRATPCRIILLGDSEAASFRSGGPLLPPEAAGRRILIILAGKSPRPLLSMIITSWPTCSCSCSFTCFALSGLSGLSGFAIFATVSFFFSFSFSLSLFLSFSFSFSLSFFFASAVPPSATADDEDDGNAAVPEEERGLGLGRGAGFGGDCGGRGGSAALFGGASF